MKRLFFILISFVFVGCEEEWYPPFSLMEKTYSYTEKHDGTKASSILKESSWDGDYEAKTGVFTLNSEATVRFGINNIENFGATADWRVEIRKGNDDVVFKRSYDRAHVLNMEVFLSPGSYYIYVRYTSWALYPGIHITGIDRSNEIEVWNDRYQTTEKYYFDKDKHEATYTLSKGAISNMAKISSEKFEYVLNYPGLTFSNEGGSVDALFESESTFTVGNKQFDLR